MATICIGPKDVTETEPRHFVAEASDLGLAPGMPSCPSLIQTTLGNGRPFRLIRATAEYARYHQHHGWITLTLYND